MTTTLGVRQNTDRDYRICTGHSKGVNPSWALIKDHNDIRKGWLRTRGRLAGMLKKARERDTLQADRRKRHKRNWRLYVKGVFAGLRKAKREMNV